jgi:hypothetical protein
VILDNYIEPRLHGFAGRADMDHLVQAGPSAAASLPFGGFQCINT